MFLVTSCHNDKKNDPNHIKVGVISGPEYVVAQTAQKVAKEKYGLDVELVQFNDYVLPNSALNDGDIDVNAYQTNPFLDDVRKNKGYKLAVVGNTFVYPLAGYSKKIKSLTELKDGAGVAIPNDPANRARALILLQKQGLIKLKDSTNLFSQVTDIVENPKHLNIIDLEGPQLPRTLDDPKVEISIINNTFAAKAGFLLKDGLFVEDKESPYVNIIVSREENKDAENVKKFVKAYQSDEVAATADKEFKGGAVKGW